MRTITAALALLALTVAAPAAVTLDIAASYDAGSNLDVYTLTVVADSYAERVTSVSTLDHPGQGITVDTAFAQVSYPPFLPTTPLSDDFGVVDLSLDTHFLLGSADILPAVSPSETASSLSGAFGLQPGAQAQSLPLMQLVAAPGSEISFDFSVYDELGHETAFVGVVPEPATGLLLLGGGVALLRRRR